MEKVDFYRLGDSMGMTIFKEIGNEASMFKVAEVTGEVTEKFKKWTTIKEIEVGYEPADIGVNCPEYSMPKSLVKLDEYGSDIEIINVNRCNEVNEWLIYYKVVLSKAQLRQVKLILDRFDVKYDNSIKENIKEINNGSIEYFSI